MVHVLYISVRTYLLSLGGELLMHFEFWDLQRQVRASASDHPIHSNCKTFSGEI